MEIDMEEEMNNFIMVWFTVAMSSCYCYGTTKLVPKGTIRFLLFLPALCLLYILPLYLKALIFSIPTAFFVTWLTSFKLLLLVFDSGPLSTPSLSLIHFLTIYCLPIKLQKPTSPTKQNGPYKQNNQNSVTLNINLGFLIHYAIKGFIFYLLTIVGYNKHMLPQKLASFLICIYAYLGLELSLVAFAMIGRVVLGIEAARPFDHPYLSTSLQDFWGRRWNRVAAGALKSTIFYPTLNGTSRLLGRKWAAIVAAVVTFVVSDVMHEVIFYYMGRVKFGGGIPTFFIFQGICVVIESTIKKRMEAKWRLPQTIIGLLVFVFNLSTFMLLALPELLELRVDDRVLAEYVALGHFLKDLGPTWAKMGRPFRTQFTSTQM
ncbi:acyl-CoA--sterol O-acyltransferase 1-like [Salvia miltiorrhiza]|uniref:acyl-CoA--sterol O-acyltransferase 1-like n=1 Tax=Salvia miltiorrhiza TaxID=226208 RepID=UPI0025AD7E5F|nr:acyl-CoA--sterol O-acyltransferase 1-like [Salvia miltiorrhiza]